MLFNKVACRKIIQLHRLIIKKTIKYEPKGRNFLDIREGAFMDGIMDTLERATKKLNGKRYQSHKFCYDTANNSVIEYDADQEVNWKEYGETEHFTKPRDLTATKQKLKSQESWFKYFLDGSRHTYKVDDMSFGKNVYPILAG